MIDELKPGTLLVRTNVVLPRSLASNGETMFPGWKCFVILTLPPWNAKHER